jgi:hypothetical protein
VHRALGGRLLTHVRAQYGQMLTLQIARWCICKLGINHKPSTTPDLHALGSKRHN